MVAGPQWADNPRARLVDGAYAEIRHALLHELRPGDRITESHLAERLGMSKTPIREALRQLEQDRLVTSIPRVGYIVPDITLQDVREVYRVREALEGVAARDAAVRIAETELARLDEQAAALRTAGPIHTDAVNTYAEFNTELHSAVVAAADNGRLSQALQRIRGQIDGATQRFLDDDIQRYERSLDEHIQILDALTRRHERDAEELMRTHIRSVGAAIMERFR